MKARTLIFLGLIFWGNTLGAHPIHISVVNLEVVTDSNRIEYSVQMYYEDFQALINHRYNTMIDFNHQSRMTFKEQQSILDYVTSNFQVADDRGVTFSPEFLRWKVEDQSIWLFFCMEMEEKIAELHIFNTLLTDLYMDQTNYVIIRNAGRDTGLEFNRRLTKHSFTL